MDKFSENLKRIRTEKNISQERLQELSGISQTAISKLELGKSSATIYTAQRLADALNVPLTEMMGMQPPPALQTYDTPLLPTERELISDFRQLNRQGRDYVLQQMEIAKKIYGQFEDLPDLENEQMTGGN